MFLWIAAVALAGLVVVVLVAFVQGGRKLPKLDGEAPAALMSGPVRLVSVVRVRLEGAGDTVACVARDDAQAWALVDALEGHADPESAVQTAVSALTSTLRAGTPWESLREGVAAANRALFEAAQAAGEAPPRGVCLAVLARDGRRLHIGHVGNVRVYRVRGERAELLTLDHSPLGDLVRQERIPRRDADAFLEDPRAPHRFVVGRALGQKPEVELSAQTVELAPGDAFFVASSHVGLFTSRAALVEARAAAGSGRSGKDDVEGWIDAVLDGPGMKPSLWGSRGVLVLRAG